MQNLSIKYDGRKISRWRTKRDVSLPNPHCSRQQTCPVESFYSHVCVFHSLLRRIRLSFFGGGTGLCAVYKLRTCDLCEYNMWLCIQSKYIYYTRVCARVWDRERGRQASNCPRQISIPCKCHVKHFILIIFYIYSKLFFPYVRRNYITLKEI